MPVFSSYSLSIRDKTGMRMLRNNSLIYCTNNKHTSVKSPTYWVSRDRSVIYSSVSANH